MKVLMFGWEFPPFASGGLGTACYGLTKALSNQNIDVTFVIPKTINNSKSKFVKLRGLDGINKIKFKQIDSVMRPYMTDEEYQEKLKEEIILGESKGKDIYGKNLYEEVYRYALKATEIAKQEEFDVIHAHDWLTYQAGINAKKLSGKPLVVHIHATEYDRTGDNPNEYVRDIEQRGFEEANLILAVSNFTKNRLVDNYSINPDKIKVVHNAVEFNKNKFERKEKDEKIVLFLGRITIQKGPEYFVESAAKALKINPNIKFIVAGNGDMMHRMIEHAASKGIGNSMLFAGFLKGADIDRAYQMADLYVMPSISEPFGITPLEAMRNGTPCLISKQSGVSEVIHHCLKVDFWDIDEMTNKMLAALNYSALHKTLQENGNKEVMTFSWDDPAKKCVDAYNDILNDYRGSC